MKELEKSDKRRMVKISIILGTTILLIVGIGFYIIVKKDPSCCGSSDSSDSSFIPIFSGVWVPIFLAAANKDRDKLDEKPRKILTVITGILAVLLLGGIVTLMIYVI